ncbi:MAG: hypothetical protein WA945_06050, partial [Arcobacteraceae bacterium]
YDTPQNIYKNPKTKTIAKSFGVANFIIKNKKEYCVRVDQCNLDTQKGDYKVKIISQSFQGDKYILEVSFDENIFTVYSSTYLENEELYLSILWKEVVEIG